MPSEIRLILVLACLWLAVGRLPAVVEAAEPVDFTRDIRPLLSDRCFVCHGPDVNQRATDLRLDDPASAHALAIVAGDAAQSELVRRIESQDDDLRMPPPDSNLSLSAAEKELFRRWIDQGGEYAEHWAFIPPQRPAVPQVQNDGWPRNEIDRFVLSRLETAGLGPQPMADLATLARRVTLDLTGLPPSVAEMDAFLAAAAIDRDVAYENLVDRLLASKRYGERMAVDWLDAARYADTYGYQNDRYRAMWPWRDWVVSAFNGNLPYDQFLTWQLAGDLLPQATQEQILATAFNRNHRQTNEGGSVEEEFRAEYVADRVNTFGAAMLGLTLECCRCHDHKYDPVSQREYYQLAAFFNSIDESGLYSHFTEATPTPTLLLASADQQQQLAAVAEEIERRQRRLADWQPPAEDYQQWRAALHDVRPEQAIAATSTSTSTSAADDDEEDDDEEDDDGDDAGPPSALSLREQLQRSLADCLIGDFPLETLEGGKLLNRVDQALSGQTTDQPQPVEGPVGQGLQLDGENNVLLKSGGDFTRNQPFTISLWMKTPQRFERAVIFHRSRAWTDSASRGYELLLEHGKLSAALVHFWPGNAIRIVSREELPLDTWCHVAMRYDGSSQAGGLQLFIDGQLAECEVVRDGLTKHISGADGVGGGDANQLAFGQRFRDVGFKGGQIDELKVFTRDLSQLELKFLYLQDAAADNVSEFLHNASPDSLHDYYLRTHPQRQTQVDELRQWRDRRSQAGDQVAEIMVMREMPQPRPTFVLLRGAYDAPGEPVQRGLPQSVFPRQLPPQATRLDLAQWLTDPQHPLTARVAVNRVWQALFGVGLVSTAEDFGLQGELPSHPQLLDWLSVDFVQAGWDLKRLVKTIVMSATYAQRSDPDQRLLELDPENRLLARGPSLRLSSEMLRDAALSAGGLLVESLGGPPVKPYQPPGLWEEKSGLAYVRDEQAGSHRRSLYTYWKRTSPPPNMMTLDASNREVCTVRRQVTLTPLQILVLLNDPQFVEAARGLAQAALMHSKTPHGRAEYVFRTLTSLSPSAEQTQVLLRMVEQQRQIFAEQPDAQQRWLSIGDQRPSPAVDPLELAAWSAVASGLMSYDETVMKR